MSGGKVTFPFVMPSTIFFLVCGFPTATATAISSGQAFSSSKPPNTDNPFTTVPFGRPSSKKPIMSYVRPARLMSWTRVNTSRPNPPAP